MNLITNTETWHSLGNSFVWLLRLFEYMNILPIVLYLMRWELLGNVCSQSLSFCRHTKHSKWCVI